MNRELKVTINGTGFAGDYTARSYGMIPHRNGVDIQLAGVVSGKLENAERFAAKHRMSSFFATHREMIETVKPDIDNVCCANLHHAPYVKESASAGVPVIVLEKPPLIWAGHENGDEAVHPRVRKLECMEQMEAMLDIVREGGSKLLYAEDFIYLDGIKGCVELLAEARKQGQGKILYQRGTCAHQGSHAIAYDTPSQSGGGSLFNKACHPLGPALFLKQIEGLLENGKPIRPVAVSAMALQVLKHQAPQYGRNFRVMQNVDDFGRLTVLFEDQTLAEVVGHDLSVSGIRNEFSVITDFAQYDIRINPNNENELFLPDASSAGDLLFREKLPTAQGTCFPRPNQFYAHGYVNECADAVACALNQDRFPQSGALMAWDTMAVLMAGYESACEDNRLVMINEYTTEGRQFHESEGPTPDAFGSVFQRR